MRALRVCVDAELVGGNVLGIVLRYPLYGTGNW